MIPDVFVFEAAVPELLPKRNFVFPYGTVVTDLIPPHAGHGQSDQGDTIKREVVVEGEGALAVDGVGEQRRCHNGGERPRDRIRRHQNSVQLSPSIRARGVIDGQRDANVELVRSDRNKRQVERAQGKTGRQDGHAFRRPWRSG